jgi:hypothetical protein
MPTSCMPRVEQFGCCVEHALLALFTRQPR